MEFGQVAEVIELPDNGGRCRVEFRPRSLSAGSFVADVTITTESLDEPRQSELTLTAFPFSREQLIRLDRLLTTWLADRSPFDIELGHERWGRFDFSVGPEPGKISSYDKPVFRIDVGWCGIAAVATFIVDQSCMRLFHEGVAGWLRLGRAAAG